VLFPRAMFVNPCSPNYRLIASLLFVVAAYGLGPSLVQGQKIELPRSPSERPKLKSIYAGTHDLTDFFRDGKGAVVIAFLGRDCPVAQQYLPRLKKVHADFREQDVVMLGVFANLGDHVLNMAQHAHDADIPFPVMLDVDHRLADLLDVQHTPEVVVLDGEMEKRYQGAIDDQYTKRGRRDKPSRNYLSDALTSILAGNEVDPAYVPASGCPIERRDPPPPQKGLTYYRDVAPIIQKRCQVCHREGEVAPFPLKTFEDAYYHASTIAETVLERRMPPWHGFLNPKFGRIKNDSSLSEKEIDTIVDWVRTGAAPGNPDDAPEPIEWPDPDAWKIGDPDYVYRMPEPFLVPKTGIVDYQFFRVKLDFAKKRWIQAVQVKPGNREVVHHIALHLVDSGDREYSGFAGMALLYGLNTEQARLINDYVPGNPYSAKVYPEGRAVRIPPHTDLIFELHYTPNNRAAGYDRSMVAFRWADSPPEEEVLTYVFRKPIGRFRIPPHEHHYRMEDSYYFKEDVLIDAIRPHFHYRGKSYRLELIERDDITDEITGRETLLSVPVWDPDWQRTYELDPPLRLKAGVELRCTGHFDNSYLNPYNPDPSATVLWGQQTSDEMFSTRFKFRRAKEEEEGEPQQATLSRGK